MDVSVCIVSWNTKDILRECIESIRQKTSGIDYEIIIVDNASSDGSANMVQEEFPQCTLIANLENLGFARANNLAARRASGEYIFYLNPDTTLVTNALKGMFEFLEKNEEYGAVGCQLTNPDLRVYYSCAGTFPTPFNELCDLLGLNRFLRPLRCFSSRELDYWDHRDSRPVDCLSGACIMIRKSLNESLKGFDNSLFMYSEDVDLCYRVLLKGFKIFFLSTETIIHYEGSSSDKRTDKHFAVVRKKECDYYFLLKHFGVLKAKRYKIAVLAGSILRALVGILMYPASRAGLLDHRSGGIIGKYSRLVMWSIGIEKINRLQG